MRCRGRCRRGGRHDDGHFHEGSKLRGSRGCRRGHEGVRFHEGGTENSTKMCDPSPCRCDTPVKEVWGK